MKNTKKIMMALLIVLVALSSCERMKVRRLVEKDRRAKVVWMREDSCYSVTRPLMSARYKAAKGTKVLQDVAHEDLMKLSQQMNERTKDHGGLKVRCYWVGFTYDGVTIDSTVVMIEPSGGMVTEMDELQDWLDTNSEFSKHY